MRRKILRMAIVVATSGLVACAERTDADGPTADIAASDSSGVRLVEISLQPDARARLPEWRLADSHTWTVASIPSRANADLLGVAGGVFLSDGSLAIGHSREREILIFDSAGTFVRAVGRAGSGPGELRSVRGPYVTGDDRLAVYDARQRRVIAFDSEGVFLGARSVAAPSARDTVFSLQGIAGVRPNGDALFVLSREDARNASGAITYQTQLAWLDSAERWRVLSPSRAAPSLTRHPPAANGALGVGMSPLAPRTLDIVCADGIATGDTHDFTITRRDAAGVLQLSVRADLTARPANAADFALEMGRPFNAEQRASPDFQRAVRDMQAQFPNATAPLISALHCDADGQLYVELAQDPANDARTILVLAPDGTPRARLSLPTSRRLLALAPHHLAVVTTDANDLESISVWRVSNDPRP